MDLRRYSSHTTTALSFVCFSLVWDVMGKAMGMVWGVAKFTALLFSWWKP